MRKLYSISIETRSQLVSFIQALQEDLENILKLNELSDKEKRFSAMRSAREKIDHIKTILHDQYLIPIDNESDPILLQASPTASQPRHISSLEDTSSTAVHDILQLTSGKSDQHDFYLKDFVEDIGKINSNTETTESQKISAINALVIATKNLITSLEDSQALSAGSGSMLAFQRDQRQGAFDINWAGKEHYRNLQEHLERAFQRCSAIYS